MDDIDQILDDIEGIEAGQKDKQNKPKKLKKPGDSEEDTLKQEHIRRVVDITENEDGDKEKRDFVTGKGDPLEFMHFGFEDNPAKRRWSKHLRNGF